MNKVTIKRFIKSSIQISCDCFSVLYSIPRSLLRGYSFIQLMKLNLIDEFQLCVHPVLAGKGLPLFENLNERILLTHLKTKTFDSGAIVFYYGVCSNK